MLAGSSGGGGGCSPVNGRGRGWEGQIREEGGGGGGGGCMGRCSRPCESFNTGQIPLGSGVFKGSRVVVAGGGVTAAAGGGVTAAAAAAAAAAAVVAITCQVNNARLF